MMMETAVSKAIEHGDFKEGLMLVKKRPLMIDHKLRGTRADTLLLAAVLHGRCDVAEQLLAMGAEPYFNCQSVHGRNVFTVAETDTQVKVLEAILEHTSHWSEPESVRAFEVAYEGALQYQDFTKIDRLLRYRPCLINHSSPLGATALGIAHGLGWLDKVKELMGMGADPWAGRHDPFAVVDAPEEILRVILKQTGVCGAGEVFDQLHEMGIEW